MSLTPEDEDALRRAVEFLEKPGFLIQASNWIGVPVEALTRNIPEKWSRSIHEAAGNAIARALEVAVHTIGAKPAPKRTDLRHKIACALSGGVGGFFGIAALALELPVSTTIMLRSIANVARSEGHDISDQRTRLACMEVFAMGGGTRKDDSAEAGYYAIRAAVAAATREAANFIAEKGLAREGAPAIVRFISVIATRFGVTVSEKAAAQSVPVIGAAGGAGINLLFIDHFQKVARGHFIVRRLEARYGEDAVRAEYDRLRRAAA